MTLLLQDHEIPQLVSVEECVRATEQAFKELVTGEAISRPRLRYALPVRGSPGTKYKTNIIAGAVSSSGMACIRADSFVVRTTPETEAKADRRQASGRNYGLLFFYSLETGELLSIMQAFSISGMRVAATNSLAARYLARKGSQVLGLFGTGKQARFQARFTSAIPGIKTIKVYSPSLSHRQDFAAEMSKIIDQNIVLVDSPEALIKGSDVIVTATNSDKPVFDGHLLEKGQLLISLGNSDVSASKSEIDEHTFASADLVVINDKESVFSNKQIELLGPIEKGLLSWDRIKLLGDVVIDPGKGRTSPDQLIYYKNNTGMGIQFAAVGAVVYRKAKEMGLGKELPSEWFGTDLSAWYDKGYYPSP